MQKFVAERCPNLKHKASIICHINERPWEDSHSYDTTWGCDGDERTQQFLERHSCLAPDPRVVFSEYENNPYNHRLYTPYGYTGAWCGWIDKCVPQDRTDCAPCLAFRHSTACFANPDIVWEPTSYDRYYDFIWRMKDLLCGLWHRCACTYSWDLQISAISSVEKTSALAAGNPLHETKELHRRTRQSQ